MNCLFILVLLGCCGHTRSWGQNNRCRCMEGRERNDSCGCTKTCERNDGCGCMDSHEKNDGCGCTETCGRSDGCGCIEPREKNNDYGWGRERSADCGCSEHFDSGTMRYDAGMRSYARMDTVPDMKNSVYGSCPMYPENCGCDRN